MSEALLYGGQKSERIITRFPQTMKLKRYLQSQLDLLRFLSEYNKMSIYALSNIIRDEDLRFPVKIGAYPLVHRNVGKLSDEGLVNVYEDRSGVHVKNVVELTLEGFIVYFQAWNRIDSRTSETISRAISNNEKILPISRHWNNFIDMVGWEKVFTEFNETCKTTGALLRFYFDDPKMEFDSLIPKVWSKTGMPFVGFRSILRELQENNKVLLYIKRNEDLCRTLKSHLILKDLYYWYIGYTDNIPQTDWNSERMSAFLEDREVSDDPIFRNKRYTEYFPEYTDLKHSFTGIFLERFIWDEPKITPRRILGKTIDGIRITLQ